MAMLTKLTLKGFKSIRDMFLDLRALNVLIGENGAGKSNLLDFFRLLRHLANGELQNFIRSEGSASALLHYGPKRTQIVETLLEYDDGVRLFKYAASLRYAAGDTLFFEDECYWHGGRRETDESQEECLGGGHQESKLSPLSGVRPPASANMYQMLDGASVYHFHDTSRSADVRQRSTPINDMAHLRPDAGNLAAVLEKLSRREPLYYRRIVETLRLMMPGFRDFVLERSQTKKGGTVTLNWRGDDLDYVFTPDQLSDGALRAMSLITLLLQPKQDLPRILVIDEPELGLHPYALSAVAGLIKAAALHCQVILATQSQAMVDHFEPEDIVVVERAGQGSTYSRLEPERLQEWLEEYSLGELWEKNVLGGEPA